MPLTPISIKLLRQGKLVDEEINRITEIKKVVENIYDNVIHLVKNTHSTYYRYPTNQQKDSLTGEITYHLSYYRINETTVLEIVEFLKKLLIDTVVEHKIVMTGLHVDTYIFIDWS